jgi:hypothetical protein
VSFERPQANLDAGMRRSASSQGRGEPERQLHDGSTGVRTSGRFRGQGRAAPEGDDERTAHKIGNVLSALPRSPIRVRRRP